MLYPTELWADCEEEEEGILPMQHDQGVPLTSQKSLGTSVTRMA